MQLSDVSPSWPQVTITGISADSRKIASGMLFAALAGASADGRQFIADALAKGAAAILAPLNTELPQGAEAALLAVAEPRQTLARIAAAFYPRQPAHIAAVTGTNGKTSSAHFARALWQMRGLKAASIGTLGTIGPDGPEGGALTTPDPVALHETLDSMARRGVDHLAFEASSHGLDQYRLDGVKIEAAGFTNLTRDHLDYHGTMEAYFRAKSRLFDALLPANGTAVLNADSDYFAPLAAIAAHRGQRLIAYGMKGRELRVIEARPVPQGIVLTLEAFGRRESVEFPLAGGFQAWNALCALGLVIGCGASAAETIPMLARLPGVRGRLERAAVHPSGAAIYVDYAHTPDALETILIALRPHVERKLAVVFGCGGNRDRGKRPIMGRIATRLADRVIVTDDNPRFEEAAAIRKDVLEGCSGALEVGDRRSAIAAGIDGLGAGDILVIAGKGHEAGQIIGHDVLPFDDADVVRELLGKSKGAAA